MPNGYQKFSKNITYLLAFLPNIRFMTKTSQYINHLVVPTTLTGHRAAGEW